MKLWPRESHMGSSQEEPAYCADINRIIVGKRAAARRRSITARQLTAQVGKLATVISTF